MRNLINKQLIQTLIAKKFNINESALKLVLVSISLLMCGWIMYIQRGRINIDAVLYLESAKLIAQGHWQQAVDIYNWPFYSSCIAAVHLLSGLDYESSAQLLNMLFFGIATASFLSLISQAGGGRLELLFGASILLSARHVVGTMLSMPMRDQGFWAFFLLAIVFFIRYVKHQKLSDAVLWQLLIVLATLFRIEGVGYLLLLPFSLFCLPMLQKKWRLWLSCYVTPMAILLGLLLISMLTGGLSAQAVGRLQELMPATLWQSLTQMLTSRAALMSEQILGKYLDDYAVISLLLSFLLIVGIKSINAIGFINLALVVKSVWHRRYFIDSSAFTVLAAASLISFLNQMFIVTSTFILVGRYAAPLGLLLMIIATFAIRPLLAQYAKHRLITAAILIFLGLFIAQNIYKNIKPELRHMFYMKAAVLWLKAENKAQQPVLYDNMLARYYANAPFLPEVRGRERYIQQQLSSPAVHGYQYIVLNFEDNQEQHAKQQLMQALMPDFHPLKQFNNQKNNKYVIIYEKNAPTTKLTDHPK